MKPFTHIEDSGYKLRNLYGSRTAAAANDSLKSKAHQPLCVKTLCTAIHNNCDLPILKWYLQQREDGEAEFAREIQSHGCPALYYAIQRNSVEAISILLGYGVDPEEYQLCFSIPPIAYAITHGRDAVVNTTGIVKELLAHGADPNIIPNDMWIRPLEMPKVNGPYQKTGPSSWCEGKARTVLAPALNLTHRYFLSRANKLNKNPERRLQIATGNNMVNLLKVPYFIIGQFPSANLIMKRVFSHIGNRNRKKKPLVMAFVGPSGHGKTEMAIQIGDLLSVKHTVIDCAQIRDRMDLLGASNGYKRSDEGSQLTNFLGYNSGKRAVIFLDEFDKTETEVRNALLVVMEKGEITVHSGTFALTRAGNYVDRRYNRPVNSSNIISIIASNIGTETINDAYNKDIKELDDEARDQVDLTSIQTKLRDVFFSAFGDPFTGRIDLIVPFLPFGHSEQAVVLHKFMLDFQDHVRDRIDLREDIKRYTGHINLDLIEDGVFCSKMANIYYVVAGGARSLLPVMDMVEDKLMHEYTETEDLITEKMNDEPLFKYIVRLIPAANNGYEIAVFKESKINKEK